jgi:hypothetical protein
MQFNQVEDDPGTKDVNNIEMRIVKFSSMTCAREEESRRKGNSFRSCPSVARVATCVPRGARHNVERSSGMMKRKCRWGEAAAPYC